MLRYRLHSGPITFRYPSAPPLLEGLDFEACSGAFTMLIGPNGAGKSTLLKILAATLPVPGLKLTLTCESTADGLCPPVALERLTPRHRAQYLAYLPQSVQPPEGYRVDEIVALGRFPHQRWWSLPSEAELTIVRDALAAVDATHLTHRPFNELSGGEQQTVLLAAVLAQQAPVLLLDEPGKALDIHHQAVLFGRLQAMAQAGKTVVAITHDLNIAARYSDRVVLIQAGRKVADGTPREVLTAPILQAAYGPEVEVVPDPLNGLPIVLPQGLSAAAGATVSQGGARHAG